VNLDLDNTKEVECDWCGETYPKSDEVTVQWANVGFCSSECRNRWGNDHEPVDLDL
jgi:hypothetical protein